MNHLITYQSKYGSSQTYAQWLGEALQAPVSAQEEADPASLEAAQVIIHCGGIYAGRILGLDAMKKKVNRLTDKRFIILAVGASPYFEEAMKQIIATALKDLKGPAEIYYARGIYDEEAMKFLDRQMCRMLRRSLKKKDPKTLEPWEKGLVDMVPGRHDFKDKVYLDPLLEALK